MKSKLTLAIVVLIFLGLAGNIPRMLGQSMNSSNEQLPSSYTKAEYIDLVVEKSHPDDRELTVCVYSYLIDNHGVPATLKMDMRAAADENDVDPAIFDAYKECLWASKNITSH